MTTEKGRVWILEDSPLEAEMARRALSATQDVSLFDDGSVLLERIATGTFPNVLVLDSELIGVGGLDVCRVIRETHGPMELPILMLTVQSAKNDIVLALQAGANDYVTKPYHVAELIARVGNLVTASRLVASQASRTRQLALGADVGVALNEGRGLPDMARRSAEQISNHFAAHVVEVWSVPMGPATSSGNTELVPIATIRNREDVVVSPQLIERVRQTSAVATNVDRQPIDPSYSVVALPLIARGEVFGVLAIATREPIADSTTSLVTLANLLALGLARARAEEDRLVLLDRERNARGEAQAANRSKDDFLAMVSHELRTPLNAITGWTSMLLSGGLDAERTRRAYETIDRNARAQAQLIDDLLDIGRITSGQLRLNPSAVDVANTAEMALESVRLSADARGVDLSSRIDALTAPIHGDAARVQQVIWNLLSNAIKFTPKGGSVSLSVHPSDDTNAVIIEVQDTGQGIIADFLPRVFERFKQADISATRARGGLGLGLAIVRHLVELHGGTIEAKSEGLGLGSTFTVSLPVGPERAAAATTLSELRAAALGPSNAPTHRAPLDRPREIEGLRVLVVDDEPDARELLRTLLESCKIIVTTASSAAEAMDLMKTITVDVVLSDVAMPGEDGLSFIRRVRLLSREQGGRVPAVALTAYARLEDRTRALRAGFNAHVAKPVEPNELLAVLSSLASR